MSLATRCTSCGTVFRVVQDQLKISDGWVRCGRCSEVFNALEALFDIDRDGGDGGVASAAGPVNASATVLVSLTDGDDRNHSADTQGAIDKRNDAGAAVEALPFSDTDMLQHEDDIAMPEAGEGTAETIDAVLARPVEPLAAARAEPRPDGTAEAPRERIAKPAPMVAAAARNVDIDIDAPPPIEVLRPSRSAARKAAVTGSRRRPDFTDARFDSRSGESGPDIDAEVAAAMDSPAMRERTRKPEFVRRAERAARWQRGPAKVGVALLSAVAGVALGAQVTHHFRDRVAADWPTLRPALQGWCGLTGCSVEAPRVIDDIVVESTTLTQGDSANAFKLAVVLHSRSHVSLTLPSVSLSLTDLNGKLISRKVLSPADCRVPAIITPGGDVALKATLSTRAARVVGYTVETFYP